MTNEELFKRAEAARRDALAIGARFVALRELRTLERDFRQVSRQLAMTMHSFEAAGTRDGLRRLLSDAAEVLLPPRENPY